MKRLLVVLAALAVTMLVSYPMCGKAEVLQPQIKSEIVMKVGSKVHLFHSGTADVKKEVCIGDVIPVYRELPAGGSMKVEVVGKVKVLSIISEHYFEAEITEGEVRVGDIAKKETAACLVQPEK